MYSAQDAGREIAGHIRGFGLAPAHAAPLGNVLDDIQRMLAIIAQCGLTAMGCACRLTRARRRKKWIEPGRKLDEQQYAERQAMK